MEPTKGPIIKLYFTLCYIYIRILLISFSIYTFKGVQTYLSFTFNILSAWLYNYNYVIAVRLCYIFCNTLSFKLIHAAMLPNIEYLFLVVIICYFNLIKIC